MDIIVNIKWDPEAYVWLAINDDIGLALESGSYDALLERVRIAIPELLELNNITNCSTISFLTEKRQMAYA